MKSDLIARYRIASQHIGAGKFKNAGAIVAHMGAMQAQDFAMARWAVGLRSASLTEKDVVNAFNKGEILRTHVLRPTWHLIANSDADWLLRLTGQRLRDALAPWNKKLNLTENVYTQSHRVLEKAMSAGAITRDAAVAALKAAKPGFPPGSHPMLLFRAEIDRLIISGPLVDGEITYALFSQRVKKQEDLPREEALARLAQRYFKSHGPATLEDFIWWSGLKTGDARSAKESVREAFATEKIAGKEFLMASDWKPAPSAIHLLPAFDEYIIGYANREAALAKKHQPRVMTRNGLFRPTIVSDGQVIGIWNRELRKSALSFEPTYFTPVAAGIKDAVRKTANGFERFIKETQMKK